MCPKSWTQLSNYTATRKSRGLLYSFQFCMSDIFQNLKIGGKIKKLILQNLGFSSGKNSSAIYRGQEPH